MNPPTLAMQLSRSIRRGRVLTAAAQLAGYDADGLGYKTFRPDAVVIPADADELVQLLRDARALDVPVTIRGAGTSLAGGPVAAQGGVVVHTSSLKQVRTIDRAGAWCEVECSVVLNQLDVALQPHGLFYPPDPSSGSVCTLGGNVAMNAGGAHCFRYGVTSNYVLGLEAVLLDGSVHRFGGPAGGRGDWRADWKRLMVGSEGTLAAFTRFWLRLLPRPEKAWTYRATFPELQSAERAIHALAAHASFPVAIELMDPRCVAMVENSPMAVGLPKDAYLLVTEIDGPAVLVDARAPAVAELLRQSGALNVEFSDDEVRRNGLWKARKVAGGLMGQLSPDFLVQDAVIPKRALAEVLQHVYDEADAAGLRVVNVFHAGDGNLHPNFLFDSHQPGELEKVETISKRLMQRVVAVGGTLSGEHGIGNDKTAYMPLVFDAEAVRLQMAVPQLFNPQHQLNPLKVFASRRFHSATQRDETTSHVDEHEALPTDRQRGLFVPFLDPIDGVWCGPASVTAMELDTLRTSDRLRFPLILDAQAPLSAQVAASGFASASSRFGPYCDNILGMNWKLPNGRIIRIGERVVKSTTGYDLLRFLLHSSGRFGEPVDFVIRLRPDCGSTGVFTLTGSEADLIAAAAALTGTCWIHWLDAVDLLFDAGTAGCCLRIVLNCPAEEWTVYEAHLSKLAAAHRLSLQGDRVPLPPAAGCPDFTLKTTPDRAAALGRTIAAQQGARCVVLCYNGVVQGYLPQPEPRASALETATVDARARVERIVQSVKQELSLVGGDWQSRHVPLTEPVGAEAAWLKQLEQEFAA